MMLIILWIIAIGVLLWRHVEQSKQPPIYDTLSYIEKAKFFWDNAARGWPVNPLNGIQSSRPPGTVLLSYPFGFNADYKGFLFRSIFIPFLIWILAILIVAWPPPSKTKKGTGWVIWPAILLLGPMPLFFQFEPASHAQWGLVDGFLASLAALGVAAAGRSLRFHSKWWLVLAAVTAAFCPLVKPSGGLVLLLTAFFWSGGALLQAWKANRENRADRYRFWMTGTGLFIILGGIVSFLCLRSEYLSPEIIRASRSMTKILQDEFNRPLTFNTITSIMHSIFGPQFIPAVLLGGYVMVKHSREESLIPGWFFWISSAIMLIVGGWFLVIETGMAQFRYFYPFALMMILPPLMLLFNKLHSGVGLSGAGKWLIGFFCALPALNLLALLLFQNPSIGWQRFTGVSVKIDSADVGVQVARKFLELTKNSQKPLTVYLINNGTDNSNFLCYSYYRKIVDPATPVYRYLMPIDWQRPSTYRLSEVLMSDYLLFRPVLKSPQVAGPSDGVKSLNMEEAVFESFLSTLDSSGGLQTVIDRQDCRLSKITNLEAFKGSLRVLVNSNTWRPVFLEANNINSGEWEPFAKVYDTIPPGYALVSPESFDASIDLLNGMYPVPERVEATRSLTIGGWMAYSAKDGLAADEMFVFLKAPNGKVKYFATARLARTDVSVGYRHPEMKDVGYQASIGLENLKGDWILGLAIGYKGKLIPGNRFNVPVRVSEIPKTGTGN